MTRAALDLVIAALETIREESDRAPRASRAVLARLQAGDVVGLSLHSNGKSVLLSYTVGEERLDLAIEPRSVLAELKRQTLGSSRSLFAKMQAALGSDED